MILYLMRYKPMVPPFAFSFVTRFVCVVIKGQSYLFNHIASKAKVSRSEQKCTDLYVYIIFVYIENTRFSHVYIEIPKRAAHEI